MKPFLHPKIYRILVKFSDGSMSNYYSCRSKSSLWDIVYSQKDVHNHDLWRSKHATFFFGSN
jgi:ribosomal protein L31